MKSDKKSLRRKYFDLTSIFAVIYFEYQMFWYAKYLKHQTFLKQEGGEEVFDKEQVDKMKADIEKLKAEKVATKPKAKKK